MKLPSSLLNLINSFSKLPSIGEKSAQRLAYYILTKRPELAVELSDALNKAISSISLCQNCGYLSEDEICEICQDTSRDPSIFCVVEKPVDLISIERVGGYKGYYHVLHYLWSPLKGIGTDKLNLDQIKKRISELKVKEVILALSSTVEGDATALYIASALKDADVKISRLAQGMPKGGELEYVDDLTISKAISNRLTIN